MEVAEQNACPKNIEGMAVWQKFSKKNSIWVSGWQAGWKAGMQKPNYSNTEKKVVSNTKTHFIFEFENGCVAVLAYDTTSGSVQNVSADCGTDKCVDQELPSELTAIASGARFAAIFTKLFALTLLHSTPSLQAYTASDIHAFVQRLSQCCGSAQSLWFLLRIQSAKLYWAQRGVVGFLLYIVHGRTSKSLWRVWVQGWRQLRRRQ